MNKIYKIKHSALRGTSVVVSELKTNRTKGLKQRVTPLLVTVAKATAAIVMGGALATSVWADDTTVPNTGKVPSSAGVYMQTYPKESTDGKNYPAFEAEVSQLFYGQAGIGKLSTFKDPSRWFTVFLNPAINPNGEKEKASYYPNDWAWYDRYGSSFNYPNRGVIGSVIVGTEASTSGQNTVVIGRKAFNEFYSDTSNFNETNKLPQNISDNNVVVGHAAGFIIPGNLNGLKKDRDSDDANKIVELTGNSVAMGSKTWSTVKAVGIGNTARAMEAYSIALGNKAQVNSGAASGIALGDEASVSRGSVSSIALGTSAIVGLTANEANAGGGVDIQNGIAIGTGSNVKANSALALGHNAHGYGVQSIAIGEGSGVNALGAIAIGLNSNAEYQNSIALGSDSRAIKSEGAGLNYSNNLQFANNPLNWSATNGATLSVGNDKLSRRIMYVAAGSSATDAVNVA